MEAVAVMDEAPTPSGVPADALLSPPAELMETDQLTRATAAYNCMDERFSLTNKLYGQYFQLYFQRLMLVAEPLKAAAQQRWPGVPLRKVLDLVDGQECILVGTLYKEMRLKPSILDEYARDLSLPRAAVSAAKFVSEDDGLVLEDEAARVKLCGDALPVATLVSGVVLAVRGHADGQTFEVSGVCYCPPGPQPPLPGLALGAPGAAPVAEPTDTYVALVSGLQLGAPGVDPLPAALLVDWLSGALGGRGEAGLASRVARLIVAGDTMCALPAPAGHLDAKAASRLAGPLRDADLLLSQLAAALPVDVMPGRNDPSNAALPQQPLHACLLPGAARYGATLSRVCNPHDCELAGVRLIGTSGQNVDDLYRCTTSEDRLALLAATLEWGHLAPSAPDTLACYPFYDRDPFLLPATPHVLFAGNQPQYATQLRRAPGPDGAVTRLVLVPSFATTGTLVLLNLRTLACHPVTFTAAPLAEQ